MTPRARLAALPAAALAVACLSPFAPAYAAVDDTTAQLHAQLCAEDDSNPTAAQMTSVTDSTTDVVPGVAAIRVLSYDISGTDRVCDLVFVNFTAPAGAVTSGSLLFSRHATIEFDDDPAGTDTMTQAMRSRSRSFINQDISDIDTYRAAGQVVAMPAGTWLVGVDNYAPVLSGVVPNTPEVDEKWRGRAYTETSLPVKWSADIDISNRTEVLVPKSATEVAKAQATLDRAVTSATTVRADTIAGATTAQTAAVKSASETRKAAVKAAAKARTAKVKKAAKKPRAKKVVAVKTAKKQYTRAVTRARATYQRVVVAQKASVTKATAAADEAFATAKKKADEAYAAAIADKKTSRYDDLGSGQAAGVVERPLPVE